MQLKGNIYTVPDKLQKNYLRFSGFELDIIKTDINHQSMHKIGITFYSLMYYYFGIFDGHYLVSERTEKEENKYQTLMFSSHLPISICEIETLNCNL